MNTNEKSSKRTIYGYSQEYMQPHTMRQSYDQRYLQHNHRTQYQEYPQYNPRTQSNYQGYPQQNQRVQSSNQGYPQQNLRKHHSYQGYPQQNLDVQSKNQEYPIQNYVRQPRAQRTEYIQDYKKPNTSMNNKQNTGKRYTMSKEHRAKINKITEIMDLVRKIIRVGNKDKSTLEQLKKQLNKTLEKYKLKREDLKKIFAILTTITLIGGAALTIGMTNKNAQKQNNDMPEIFKGATLVSTSPFGENLSSEEYILHDGSTRYVVKDLNGNIIGYYEKMTPNTTKSIDSENDADTRRIHDEQTMQTNQNKNSYIYLIDKLPNDLIENLANAIRNGNSKVPNSIYSFGKIDKDMKDEDIVKTYFERLDASKGNPYNNNTVMYHAPDVLLSVIKYYYQQTKNANPDMMNIYYRETEGKVLAATVQEARYSSDSNPRKYHNAINNGNRLSGLDKMLLSYATLDNVIDKVGFSEVDINPVVNEAIYDMHDSLPGFLQQIVEFEKTNNYDEI